ncbi:non-ribosomal peptide synthetase [Pedobacter kyonggii]|uniref:Amino acid adenylation domain-containing protein n=1 Tax=Pedobacter kyonggii TaxID=1926871 RepID=A0A4Q9HHX0_9SPHI|nr:non-ribosomal peptide synthetase [Pedobacter kyonggii]TBO44290.1 amino acid adenylation domain-containing protein [Pedobacter kyonggii]
MNVLTYPLIHSQKRIWHVEKLFSGLPIHHLAGTAIYSTVLDFDKLTQAFFLFVESHDAVRLRLSNEAGEMELQYIEEYKPFAIPYFDFSVEADPERSFSVWLKKESERTFDFYNEALFRFAFFKLDNNRAGYFINFHHFIADGWSIQLFTKFVSQSYNALVADQKIIFPETRSYIAYLLDEQRYFSSSKFERNKRFWLNKFESLPSVLPVEINAELKGELKKVHISSENGKKIKEIAEKYEIPLSTLFLALTFIYQHYVTGSDDLVIGLPVFNRAHQNKKDFGMLTSTMPLRIGVDKKTSFGLFLNMLSKELKYSFIHQKYPYDLLVRDLELRAKGFDGLFDVCFNFYNTDLHQASGIDTYYAEIEEIYPGFQLFNLYIVIKEWLGSDQLELNFTYKTSIYSDEDITHMHSAFLQMLERISLDDDCTVLELLKSPAFSYPSPSVLAKEGQEITEEAKYKLLFEFNSTSIPISTEYSLMELFENQVSKNPQAIAVKDFNHNLTYRELNARANSLARVLIKKGVGAESIIPIMVERSIDMVIGIFAILKAGGAYLPIDTTFPKSRISYILEDSKAFFLLTTSDLTFLVDESVQIICLDSGIDRTESEDNIGGVSSPNDLAYIIYTSGSTGNPKGVMIENRSLLNRLQWMQQAYPIFPGDTILQKTSISFDVSVWELFWWAIQGATLALLVPNDEKFPDKIIDAIEHFGVTTMHFVPSMFGAFLESLNDSIPSDEGALVNKIRSVRQIFSSGEALLPWHVNEFNNKIFKHNGTQLINLYGPTEATIDVSYYNCPSDIYCDRVFIGNPINNIKLFVLGENMELLPIGEIGELYIEGVGLARGYLNNPELTKSKFVNNPFDRSKRLYKTGDQVRWSLEGKLEYIGRIDHQVKLRGYRIETGEIEISLCRHFNVRDAVVTIQENANSSRFLCAFVILKDPSIESDFRLFLEEWLPDYMIPSDFISIKEFPLNLNGKIERKALIVRNYFNKDKKYVAPVGDIEVKLSSIWESVLGVEKIGIHDNFFSIGGDSIKSLSVISKAKHQSIFFNFQQLFENPTIFGLSKSISVSTCVRPLDREEIRPFGMLSEEDRSLIPIGIEDAYPLSVLQSGLIFQSEISTGSSLYHDVFSYKIKGIFYKSVFEKVIEELVRRHPIIRTSYHLTGFSEHIQMVHSSVPIPLEITDLQSTPASDQNSIIKEYVDRLRAKKFTWENPGLIRFHFHILNDSEYIYTLSFHDSALDGWSVNTLHAELFNLYYSFLNHNVPEMPTLKSQFRDFIAMERHTAASKMHKEFWDKALKDFTYTKLPIWPFPDSKSGKVKVDFYKVQLPQDFSDGVKDLARSIGVPVKSVLLAAHIRLLSVLTGEEDIITGYEYSGRPEDIDGEKILGLFLNTLPFRGKCGSGTWRDLILEVYQQELQLIPHRRYPMAQIKQSCSGQMPLFETVFNFTHFHVLKELMEHKGFDLTDVKLEAETEFILRAEFSLHPFTDEISLWLHYHSNVFNSAQIQSISSYYRKILQSMINDPSAFYQSETVLSPEEIDMQLIKLNSHKVSYRSDLCFYQLFEEHAKKDPLSAAISFGDITWSYKELNSIANNIAWGLNSLGVNREKVVGVMMDRCLDWAATIIAIFKAGGTYLPIDPAYPTDRICAMLDKCKCSLVITGERNTDIDSLHLSLIAQFSGAVYTVSELRAKTECSDNLNLPVTPDNLAYIIFTSGSTGQPKGAMIEHKGMLNHLFSKVNDLQLGSKDIIAQNASHCFDISIWQLFSALLVGARTIIYPNQLILKLDQFIEHLVRDKVTILELVPSYLDLLITYTGTHLIKFYDFKYLLVTGEPVKPKHVKKWFSQYPNIPIVNAYGPTEASDDITHHIMYDSPESLIVPIGKPVQNLNIYILDKNMQLVPLGSFGQICVSGVGVGRGYVNDTELTDKVFTLDPFHKGEQMRLYKTGDIGRWLPDGILELSGRLDGQIKLNGFRIEIEEVESHLLNSSLVKEVAVILHKGELIAFIVANESFDLKVLKDYFKLKAPYYMLPGKFYMVEKLPLSSNGKILKNKLFEQVGMGYLEVVVSEVLPPETTTEIKIASEWAKVLRIAEGHIHKRSNFFEIGGHSLKAMELAFNSKKKFSINDLYKFPLLEDFANYLDNNLDRRNDDLLIDFSVSGIPKRLSIIGCTYAGGNAINFKPFFDSILQESSEIGCYAIEYPGHTYGTTNNYEDIEKTALLCLERITELNTPIVIWGHCSGSALALEIARLMEERGMDLKQIFLGGKVLSGRLIRKGRQILSSLLSPFMAVNVDGMNDDQIKKWLIEKSGFKDFETLGDQESKFVIKMFRHDAASANQYIQKCLKDGHPKKLRTTIYNVIAKDDLLTKGYLEKYRNWNFFSNDVRLITIESGGHYFLRSRPTEISKIINDLI